MSFPRDAILGTGFAPNGRACPISPDAKPKFNKITSPRPKIRTIGDLLKAELPHLWPQIEANVQAQQGRYPGEIALSTPLADYENWSAREFLTVLFTWSNTPEGDDFWRTEYEKA